MANLQGNDNIWLHNADERHSRGKRADDQGWNQLRNMWAEDKQHTWDAIAKEEGFVDDHEEAV